MISLEIRVVAPDEERLRLVIDEIYEASIRLEREASAIEREVGGTKGSKLAGRKRAIAMALDDLADTLDQAKPRRVL